MGKSAGEARVGRSLGKYTLLRVIGEGGMAVVYEAVHRNGNRVALKLLRPEVSIGVDVRARFVREGYAANKVGHPGAVRILDDDEREGLAFLVMELLEGTTLDAFARSFGEANGESRGRVPEALALAIVVRLLDVLVAAHAASVIHRDIKPENVFLDRSGTVKVLDFGIARVSAPGETSSTVTGRVLGTPAFVPPEQAYGRRAEVDARSDVYAVGATLFTLLSGRLVHEAGSPEEALILAATEHAPPVASVVEVDPRIAAIVDKALAYERDERWPSAVAMRDALAETYATLFGAPVPETLDFGLAHPAIAQRPVSRRPSRAALVAAIAVVVVGGVGASFARVDTSAPRAVVSSVASVELRGNGANGSGGSAIEPAPSSAPHPAVTTEPPRAMVAHVASSRAPGEPPRAARVASSASVPVASAMPRSCGVDIDEEGRKWPRRCP